jgi:hypothetical protein
MEQYQRRVGAGELCAAVQSRDVSLLRMLLPSEGSMEPALVEDVLRRGICLVHALCEAVSGSLAWHNLAMLAAFLAPPDRWGPVTPCLLAEVVRHVGSRLKLYPSEEQLWTVLDMLHKAGVDLDADGCALLMAAIDSQNLQVC